MVLQRPCQTCRDGFLLPKPSTKLKPTFVKTEADSNWQWFNVQKRLLSTTRPEKLWRYYKDLKLSKWDDCGLCIQLGKVLSKRMGHRWVLSQAVKDGISFD